MILSSKHRLSDVKNVMLERRKVLPRSQQAQQPPCEPRGTLHKGRQTFTQSVAVTAHPICYLRGKEGACKFEERLSSISSRP
jgi:hypothetical protein